ncbi:MAG: type 1 glutamine amidotransferase [Alphaproteobacteria bacterium]|nr:MAG: type 1 glutamine amidotransferase [Alphaproteobacteria bacterium]
MRIGILETGDVAAEMKARFGDYPAMNRALLAPVMPEAEFFSVPLIEGAHPERPEQADGWIVTGSRHGVYDDLPWIGPLRDFLRDARRQGVPVAGICFGHQILAEALGGKAELSDRGWAVGLERYRVTARPGWMQPWQDHFAGLAMHRDQVTALAPDASLLAAGANCPFAALAYGDPEAPDAISVQTHPEFTPDFLRELIIFRRGTVVPEEVADRALASLDAAPDNALWAEWLAGFFRRRRSGGR